MALTCQTKVEVYHHPDGEFYRIPLQDQFEAWIVAETLREELGEEGVTPGRFKTLHGMALDLAEWIEGQAA